MVVIVTLSMWIMLRTTHSIEATPGAAEWEMILASHKVKVEQVRSPEGVFTYRFLSGSNAGTALTTTEFQTLLDQQANTRGRPMLYRIFNVSSAAPLAWVALGLGGQIIFSGRMFVQWLASERERRSVVPPVFWYMSLAGAVMLAAYFIWRQDMVGLLGQSVGLVIYIRNIRLLHLPKAPAKAPSSPSNPPASPPVPG